MIPALTTPHPFSTLTASTHPAQRLRIPDRTLHRPLIAVPGHCLNCSQTTCTDADMCADALAPRVWGACPNCRGTRTVPGVTYPAGGLRHQACPSCGGSGFCELDAEDIATERPALLVTPAPHPADLTLGVSS